MKWLYDVLQQYKVKPQLLWSEKDYAPLVDTLRDATGLHSMILLKGSRGMALENVLEGLNG